MSETIVKDLVLDLQQLAEFDEGKIDFVFAKLVSRINADLLDRPGDLRPRKLPLVLVLKPLVDDQGNLQAASIEAFGDYKLPKMQTMPKVAKPTNRGLLIESITRSATGALHSDIPGQRRFPLAGENE